MDNNNRFIQSYAAAVKYTQNPNKDRIISINCEPNTSGRSNSPHSNRDENKNFIPLKICEKTNMNKKINFLNQNKFIVNDDIKDLINNKTFDDRTTENHNFFVSRNKFNDALFQYRKLHSDLTSGTIKPRESIRRNQTRWTNSNNSMGDLLNNISPTMVSNRSRSCSPKRPNIYLRSEPPKVTKVMPIQRDSVVHSRNKVRELTILYETNSNRYSPINKITESRDYLNDSAKLNSRGNMVKTRRERRVHFEPHVMLFSATFEGELDLVVETLKDVEDRDISKDDGLTLLHTAICAQKSEIVKFLISYGCNVNAMDGDGWTPLHCAAILNNTKIVKLLIEAGAAPYSFTNDIDPEIPLDKCNEDELGYEECRDCLLKYMDSMGVINNGLLYTIANYESANDDELSFKAGEILKALEFSKDTWWWKARIGSCCGFVPKNYLSLYLPQKY